MSALCGSGCGYCGGCTAAWEFDGAELELEDDGPQPPEDNAPEPTEFDRLADLPAPGALPEDELIRLWDESRLDELRRI